MAENNETSWELSAYLDGELGEAETERVARALRDDAALQRELAGVAATRELLRRLPRYRGGKELTERIVAAAEQLQARGSVVAAVSPGLARRFRRFAAAAVLLAAAGAGVMVTATWFGRDDRTPGTTIVRTDVPDRDDDEAASSPSPSAKDRGIVRTVDGVDNEVIFTHDLGVARRDVESALLSNGLADEAKAKSAKLGRGRIARGGGGNFRYNRLSTETVSYEVVGTAEQVTRLRTDLRRIRASQFVAQAPQPTVTGPVDKLLAEQAKKTDTAAGTTVVGKGGGRPGPGAAAKPGAPLAKRSVRGKPGGDEPGFDQVRNRKQAIVQTEIVQGQDPALKELNLLLDMVWGGQEQNDSAVLAAGQQAAKTPDDGSLRKGSKSVGGKAEGKGQSQHKAFVGRQQAESVTANVRRLVITLSKSPLTRAEAVRKAATERAADAAKAANQANQ